MTKVRIIYYQDEGGGWRWRLKLGNNRIFAVSGESFASKRNAKRAAGRLGDLLWSGTFDPVVVEEGER